MASWESKFAALAISAQALVGIGCGVSDNKEPEAPDSQYVQKVCQDDAALFRNPEIINTYHTFVWTDGPEAIEAREILADVFSKISDPAVLSEITIPRPFEDLVDSQSSQDAEPALGAVEVFDANSNKIWDSRDLDQDSNEGVMLLDVDLHQVLSDILISLDNPSELIELCKRHPGFHTVIEAHLTDSLSRAYEAIKAATEDKAYIETGTALSFEENLAFLDTLREFKGEPPFLSGKEELAYHRAIIPFKNQDVNWTVSVTARSNPGLLSVCRTGDLLNDPTVHDFVDGALSSFMHSCRKSGIDPAQTFKLDPAWFADDDLDADQVVKYVKSRIKAINQAAWTPSTACMHLPGRWPFPGNDR